MKAPTFRDKLKEQLVAESKGNPVCALCGKPAFQMHEIIAPPLEGGKYNPKDTPLARAVYVIENVTMLCPACNVNIANSRKGELLTFNTTKHGYDRMATALRRLASLLKSPESYIPASISFRGEWVKIL